MFILFISYNRQQIHFLWGLKTSMDKFRFPLPLMEIFRLPEWLPSGH